MQKWETGAENRAIAHAHLFDTRIALRYKKRNSQKRKVRKNKWEHYSLSQPRLAT